MIGANILIQSIFISIQSLESILQNYFLCKTNIFPFFAPNLGYSLAFTLFSYFFFLHYLPQREFYVPQASINCLACPKGIKYKSKSDALAVFEKSTMSKNMFVKRLTVEWHLTCSRRWVLLHLATLSIRAWWD